MATNYWIIPICLITFTIGWLWSRNSYKFMILLCRIGICTLDFIKDNLLIMILCLPLIIGIGKLLFHYEDDEIGYLILIAYTVIFCLHIINYREDNNGN